MNSTNDEDEVIKNCTKKLFPIVDESSWPLPLHVVLYLMGLFYLFYGVNIASDVFMNAIEKITSKVKLITLPYPESETGYLEVKVKVWNPAVANLSLLALGTSAPEILLACVEIMTSNFHAGELGPGTIVGSAAFNLFVITSICVSIIPKGETKRIVRYKVFWVTVVTCIGSYAWMAIIIKVWSPGIVTITEALITFLSFPMLIIVAFFADKNFSFKNIRPTSARALEQQVKDMAPSLRVKQLAKILERNERPYAWRRMTKGGPSNLKLSTMRMQSLTNANRLFGKLVTAPSNTLSAMMNNRHHSKKCISKDTQINRFSYFTFLQESVCVEEDVGTFYVPIQRSGNISCISEVHVKTVDGTAKKNEDYVPVDTIIHFAEGESTNYIEMQIVDDDLSRDAGREYFQVYIVSITQKNCLVGKLSECKVYISNSNSPGTVTFGYSTYLFKQSDGEAVIPVYRFGGTKGQCTVQWKANGGSAIENVHYSLGCGEVSFEDKEQFKDIVIPFIMKDEIDINQEIVFSVGLLDPYHLNQLGELCETSVNIVNNEAFNQILDEATTSGEPDEGMDEPGYANAFIGAVTMELEGKPGLDEEGYSDVFKDAVSMERAEATCMDYFWYLFGLVWRLLAAFIPPPKYCEGWPAFVFSLLFIGVITGLIEDMTKVLACNIGVTENIAAITMVALGTSIPDTFASMVAAKQEPTADDSIGNILGSNSVNVFLGLGLPWLIASIYWNYQGKEFEVHTDGVVFSVTLYTVLAAITIVILIFRRNSSTIRGELGGPQMSRYITSAFLFLLWLLFIVISILNAEGIISID